jgi:tRNA(fMet)-specific endonuclease VapC
MNDMDDYLLDSNITSAFFDGYNKFHNDAVDFVKNVGGEGFIYIPRIVIGEILFGHKLFTATDKNRQQLIEKGLSAFKNIKDVDKHTVEPYSDIRAALFNQYGPRDKKGKVKKVHPESLVDRTTSKELGVQENDIWIAAIAVEYNMVLVTEDKINQIKTVESRLRVRRWCKSPTT